MSCPSSATLVYSGYAAGKHYQQSGSGTNTLCLTDTPTWGPDYNDGNQNGATIYGAEFQTTGYGLASLNYLNQSDGRCAVCLAPRSATVMIPGTNVCPAGWTREYAGYLMANHYTQEASTFVCVDQVPDLAGSPADQDGTLWYPTEVGCGTLPCLPYVANREVTCAVCSR